MDQIILFYLGIFPPAIFLLIWRRLGGWPEAWYRIKRIPYFVQVVFGPDGTPDRYVHAQSIIRRHSPPMFEFSGKLWGVDEENQARDTGRPCYYYNFDDLSPIPILHWKKGTKIDPALVRAAFKNDTIERMHVLGQKHSRSPWLLVGLAIVVLVVVAVIGAYYSYNTFCAVTPEKCGLPSGGFHG